MRNAESNNALHAWRFSRVGGFDQVRIERGADIAALAQLDQKLWTALSCPTNGLEIDDRTLKSLDTDNDGRIRAPEIIAAAQWTARMLKNPDDLTQSSPSLPLAAINDTDPQGQQLLSSARQILANLDKADAATITEEDVSDTVKIFANTVFNGDGIVPAAAAEDELVQKAIQDIIDCTGAEIDRGGQSGISWGKLEQFF